MFLHFCPIQLLFHLLAHLILLLVCVVLSVCSVQSQGSVRRVAEAEDVRVNVEYIHVKVATAYVAVDKD